MSIERKRLHLNFYQRLEHRWSNILDRNKLLFSQES